MKKDEVMKNLLIYLRIKVEYYFDFDLIYMVMLIYLGFFVWMKLVFFSLYICVEVWVFNIVYGVWYVNFSISVIYIIYCFVCIGRIFLLLIICIEWIFKILFKILLNFYLNWYMISIK